MTDEERVVIHSGGDDAVVDAISAILTASGRALEFSHEVGDPGSGMMLDGVVYVPGLLEAESAVAPEPAAELVGLLESVRPRLRSRDDGGARVVAVGSRDWLGWPGRTAVAAQAAGLLAVVRSLALGHGQAGVTVNCVLALPPTADQRRDRGTVPGTHLFEPVALTPEPVRAEDIAATVEFFLDRGSAYITGQALHCCGGASLISSLSV